MDKARQTEMLHCQHIHLNGNNTGYIYWLQFNPLYLISWYSNTDMRFHLVHLPAGWRMRRCEGVCVWVNASIGRAHVWLWCSDVLVLSDRRYLRLTLRTHGWVISVVFLLLLPYYYGWCSPPPSSSFSAFFSLFFFLVVLIFLVIFVVVVVVVVFVLVIVVFILLLLLLHHLFLVEEGWGKTIPIGKTVHGIQTIYVTDVEMLYMFRTFDVCPIYVVLYVSVTF